MEPSRRTLLAAGLFGSLFGGVLPAFGRQRPSIPTYLLFDDTSNISLMLTAPVTRLLSAAHRRSHSSMVRFTQDAVGGRKVIWPETWCWPGGHPPELSTEPHATDMLFRYIASDGVVSATLVNRFGGGRYGRAITIRPDEAVIPLSRDRRVLISA